MLGDLFSETGGLPLVKRHPVRQRYRLLEIAALARQARARVAMKPAHVPFNPSIGRPGRDCEMTAEGQRSRAFLSRAFPAVWEQQRDLADPGNPGRARRGGGSARAFPGSNGRDHATSPPSSAGNRAKMPWPRTCSESAGLCAGWRSVLGQDRIRILLADALKSQRKPYRLCRRLARTSVTHRAFGSGQTSAARRMAAAVWLPSAWRTHRPPPRLEKKKTSMGLSPGFDGVLRLDTGRGVTWALLAAQLPRLQRVAPRRSR